ncbi:hypothetical protein ABI59_20875 [Acidobacteria bacterium Mor1]|nr:hypothetical protein ABI59_20875 [Acidobacteria bacterium Mor1]
MLLLACGAADQPVRVELPAEAWLEDLDALARELPSRHVRPFHHVSEEQWRKTVADLGRRIPDLSESEIVVELTRLVALLGDGHTELLPHQSGTGFHRLPLVFREFADGMRVIAVAPGQERLLGATVQKIGGRSVEQLLEAVAPLVARDNDMELLHSGPEYLATPEVLAYIGAAVSPDEVPLTVSGSGGDTEDHVVSSIPRTGLGEVRWIRGREQAGGETPLMAKNPAKDYWFERVEEHGLVFVKYNRCDDQGGEPSIRRFAKLLSKQAAPREFGKLVLDLRHNSGGDNKKSKPLVDFAVRWKESMPERQVFILVGRMTFSAAMDAVLQLRRRAAPILIGERPRGRPNTVGDVETLRLPNSGLRLDYSTRIYDRAPDLASEAYLPLDVPAPSTWEDYVSGRDPSLEAAIAYGPAG